MVQIDQFGFAELVDVNWGHSVLSLFSLVKLEIDRCHLR